MLFSVYSFSQNIETVPINEVNTVPIFPGCEKGNNKSKTRCLSKKIQEHTTRYFRAAEVSKNLGLSGRQRISAIFKIDTAGRVIEIRARAAHKNLEKEAIRVIKLLPIFKPGINNGKKVIVPYSLPIIFEIN
tara:strand:- start:126 stop:521 length:396 start_codon:yes stop_codon:yes gene_type:complete